MASGRSVTLLLQELGSGRREALNEIVGQVYDELRRIAHSRLQTERANHTLDTTALVHEAYVKLVDRRKRSWQNRAHFYAAAAQAMRRILISYARNRSTEKRGGVAAQVTFDQSWGVLSEERSADLLALDEALSRLEEISPRHARIVESRFFGGLTVEETAQALGVAPITVTRDWRMARAWLKNELSQEISEPEA